MPLSPLNYSCGLYQNYYVIRAETQLELKEVNISVQEGKRCPRTEWRAGVLDDGVDLYMSALDTLKKTAGEVLQTGLDICMEKIGGH